MATTALFDVTDFVENIQSNLDSLKTKLDDVLGSSEDDLVALGNYQRGVLAKVARMADRASADFSSELSSILLDLFSD